VRYVKTFTLDNPTHSYPNSPTYDYVDISHPTLINPYYILAPAGWFFCRCPVADKEWDAFSSAWIDNPSSGYQVEHLIPALKRVSDNCVRAGWMRFSDLNAPAWWKVADPEAVGVNPTYKLLICEAG
jgi:hypothetical protein